MITSVGDFTKMGVHHQPDGVQFTVALTGAGPWALRLLNPSTLMIEQIIPLTDVYRIGKLYSVRVQWEECEHEVLAYDFCSSGERVVDPYSPLIFGRDTWADEARNADDYIIYGGFVRQRVYPWKNPAPKLRATDMVMYKLHLRGFTMGEGNGVPAAKRGCDLGLIARLPYLKELGVTALELQPIYDFEEFFIEEARHIGQDGHIRTSMEATGKLNYWGYGPAAYLAPKASYFGGAAKARGRCKEMIDAIHGAGMELIMEVSFTPELGSGFITDVLWHWVKEYHVDGFHLLGGGLPFEEILSHPGLASTKLFCDHIPESLLAAQVGEKRLFYYEDSFCQVVRQMSNHMGGSMSQFAGYLRRQNLGYGFVNYAANTTGFTLFDSVSYGEKHNEANGEANRDGSNSNFSYNFGVEGETNSKKVRQLRHQQMKNLLCNVMLSQAVPLLLAGDEVANTASGNNNPYCQDNAIGWTSFGKTKGRDELLAFTQQLIAFRKAHPILRSDAPMRLQDYQHHGMPDLSYHAYEPWLMSVGEELRCIGMLYGGDYVLPKEEHLYIIYNYQYDEAQVALPKLPKGKRWQQLMCTGDATCFEEKAVADQHVHAVPGSTVTILVSQDSPEEASPKASPKRRAKKS